MDIDDTVSCLVCRQVAWVPRSWCPGSIQMCACLSLSPGALWLCTLACGDPGIRPGSRSVWPCTRRLASLCSDFPLEDKGPVVPPSGSCVG